MPLPRVLVVSLGGTITMTADAGDGIRPTLTGEQLLAAEPRLGHVASLEAVTPFMLPGASLTPEHLREVARLLAQRLRSGAFAGAVVVQGTDTIEDTAFVLDLLLDLNEPVVVTGAMRGPQSPGADGPSNLLGAVTTAAASVCADLGVLVVLNDQIHAARRVRKGHTSVPSAFESPGGGPVGSLIEGEVRLWARPIRRRVPMLINAAPRATGTPAWAQVAQLALGLGEDARIAEALPGLGYAGAVVEAMGAGHVPAAAVDRLAALASAMPVVLASRVAAGGTFTHTYGFAGSEIDLLSRGLLPAGDLSANKARLLLGLLLAEGASTDDIRTAFA